MDIPTDKGDYSTNSKHTNQDKEYKDQTIKVKDYSGYQTSKDRDSLEDQFKRIREDFNLEDQTNKDGDSLEYQLKDINSKRQIDSDYLEDHKEEDYLVKTDLIL